MTTKQATVEGMTAAQFVDSGFLCSPDRLTRRVQPLQWIPPQRAVIDAFDAIDSETRLPKYSEFGYFAIKKAGKDTVLAGLGVADMVANPYEHEPRDVAIVSGSADQAVSAAFAQAKQFCRNHPFLRAPRVKEYATELVYQETRTEGRTGGKTMIEHVLRALPAGNPSRLHGRNLNLVLFTETWLMNYELLEALAPSPARRAPRQVHGSYAGLRSQAKAGNVLWDLELRRRAGDDRLFVEYLAGPDAWRSVPWISEQFIEGERRRLAHVPQKFARLWENRWASDDAGNFLTAAEIADATDARLVEPTEPIGDAVLGLDLGLSKDTAFAVVSNIALDGKLVVQAARCWRPMPGRPISLIAVEDDVCALALQLGVHTIIADQWQAALMAERLRRRLPHVDVRTMVCDAGALDRWATSLKTWFRDRTIRIPAHAELVEQLESLRGEEMRRKDRVRFTATNGDHDDGAVALCLSTESGRVRRRPKPIVMGRLAVADMPIGCRVETYFHGHGAAANCFLLDGHAVPGDPLCASCEGLTSVRELHAAHGASDDLRTFARMLAPNRFQLERRTRAFLQDFV